MKGQPCLIEATVPLKARLNYVSLCGRVIESAYFTASWDEQRMGIIIFAEPDRLCEKCRKVLAARIIEPGERYLYATVPGSEVKQTSEDVA